MTVSATFNAIKGNYATDLGTLHHFTEGVYAKQMHLPKGFTAYSHKHNYDHLSVLAQGKVLLSTDHGQQEYTAPACINIVADTNHAILALEDTVWFCIHATEETDVSKIDEVLIGE